MSRFLKSTVAAAALGLWLAPVSLAQDASEMAVRVQQLEEQVRLLSGQVEELTYEVKQLRSGAGQKAGELQPPAAPTRKKQMAAVTAEPLPENSGNSDAIMAEDLGQPDPIPQETANAGLKKAPGPAVLGALSNSASAQPDDGGFQGKVLVPPSQQEPGDDAFVMQGGAPDAAQAPASDAIETVSLDQETPEALYERSNESLLRRQFGDAEAGFTNFLNKYPDHSLAGSAQFWLGETFFAQGDFKHAAQNFLQGYKTYPKSRRAADSLLKLGISLSRLGQPEQACAAYAAVSAEYPKAVEARKRAQAEAKRAACAS